MGIACKAAPQRARGARFAAAFVTLALLLAPTGALVTVHVDPALGEDGVSCGATAGAGSCATLEAALNEGAASLAAAGDASGALRIEVAHSAVINGSASGGVLPLSDARNVTLVGLGNVTLGCVAGERLFDVGAGASLTLSNLFITACVVDESGGVVAASGDAHVTFESVTIIGVSSGGAGGVFHATDDAVVELRDGCLVRNAAASLRGGVGDLSGHARVVVSDSQLGVAGPLGSGEPVECSIPEVEGDARFWQSLPPECVVGETPDAAVSISADEDGTGHWLHLPVEASDEEYDTPVSCSVRLSVPDGYGVRLSLCGQERPQYPWAAVSMGGLNSMSQVPEDFCVESEARFTVRDGAVDGPVLYDGCGTVEPVQSRSHEMFVTYSIAGMGTDMAFALQFEASSANIAHAEGSTGGAFSLADDAAAWLSNSTFTSLSLAYGGAFALSGRATLNATDVRAHSCVAREMGGALRVAGNSSAYLVNSSLEFSFARTGGCVSLVDGAVVNLVGSTLIGCRSEQAGAAHADGASRLSLLAVPDGDPAEGTVRADAGMFACRSFTTSAGVVAAGVALVSFKDVTIADNIVASAPGSVGGAAMATGMAILSMHDCMVERNSARQAGAVEVQDLASFVAWNTTFHDNFATLSGGVVAMSDNAKVSVSDSLVVGNKGGRHAGFLYATNGAVGVVVMDTEFLGNVAESGHGGVLYAIGSGGATFDFTNCSFTTNSGHRGGVFTMIADDVSLRVVESTFTGNVGLARGGVINVFEYPGASPSEISFSSCQFMGNRATGVGLADGGGVVHLEGASSNVRVSGCTVTGGESTSADVAYTLAGTATIEDTDVQNCEVTSYLGRDGSCFLSSDAGQLIINRGSVTMGGQLGFHGRGGAVYVGNGGTALFSDLTVMSFSAAQGGAVDVGGHGSSFVAQNCTFQSHSVTSNGMGGVIAVHDGGLATLNSSVLRQGAATLGGIAAVTGADSVLSITGGWLSDAAAASGGLIYAADGASVLLDGTKLSDGHASSGGAMYLDESNCEATDVQIFECGADGWGAGGVGVVSRGSSLKWVRVDASSNLGGLGGVLQIVSGSTASLVSSSFRDNRASSIGGVLDVLSSAPVILTDCVVEDNSATSGGALSVHSDGDVRISGGRFERNSASFGGAVFALNNGRVTAVDVDFVGNQASDRGATIAIQSTASVAITGSRFIDNIAVRGGAVLDVSNDATAHVYDCFISGSSSTEGGVVMAQQRSVLAFNHTDFQKNFAGDGGILRSLGFSSVSFDSCTFEGDEAVALGGLVYATQSATTTFVNSTISGSHAALSGGVAHLVDSATIELSACTVKQAQSARGGVVTAEDTVTVVLRNSTFDNCTAEEDAGVAFMQGSSRLRAEGCVFTNNRAKQGGVVSVLGHSGKPFAELQDCIALGNVGQWGAVVHAMTHMLPCHIAVLRGGYFSGNVAHDAGGVFFWMSQGSHVTTFDELMSGPMRRARRMTSSDEEEGHDLADADSGSCNLLALQEANLGENHADGYGRLVATSAARLRVGPVNYTSDQHADLATVLLASNSSSDASASVQEKLSALLSDQVPGWQLTIQSGLVISQGFRVSAIDLLGQDVAGGSLSFLVGVDVYKEGDLPPDSPFAAAISANPSDVVVYGETLRDSSAGFVEFLETTVQGQPGSTVALTFSVLGTSNVLTPAVGTFKVSPCVRGEVLIKSRCVRCTFGYYSWDVNGVACEPCPDHAFCPGGDVVIPHKGYWRADNASVLMLPCPNPESCRGAPVSVSAGELLNVSSIDETCREGYKGNLCGSCADGWARYDRLTCARCLDHVNNVITLIAVSLVAIIVGVVAVQIQRHLGEKGMDTMTLVLKILASYFQYASVAASLNVLWPDVVQQAVFGVQTSVGALGSRLIFVDCIIAHYQSSDSPPVAFVKAAGFICCVPVSILLSIVFWVAVYQYRSTWRTRAGLESRSIPMLRRITTTNIVVTCIVIIFFVHPVVTDNVLVLLTCREIVPDSGEQFLQHDLDVPCFDDRHLTWISAVAIPAAVLVVVGVPLAGFYVLWSKVKPVLPLPEVPGLGGLERSPGGSRSNSDDSATSNGSGGQLKLATTADRVARARSGSGGSGRSARDAHPAPSVESASIIPGAALHKSGSAGPDTLPLGQRRDEDAGEFARKRFGFLFLGYTDAAYYYEIVIVARKVMVIVAAQLLAVYGPQVQVLGALFVTFCAYNIQVVIRPYRDPRLSSVDQLALIVILWTFFVGALTQVTFSEEIALLLGILVVLADLFFLLYTAWRFWGEINHAAAAALRGLQRGLGLCPCVRQRGSDRDKGRPASWESRDNPMSTLPQDSTAASGVELQPTRGGVKSTAAKRGKGDVVDWPARNNGGRHPPTAGAQAPPRALSRPRGRM